MNGYYHKMSLQQDEYQINITPRAEEKIGERERKFGTLGELTNQLTSFKKRRSSLPSLELVFGVPRLCRNQVLPSLRSEAENKSDEKHERHTI